MSVDRRRGFAKQAVSDFRVFEALCDRLDVPVSHRLHYLQMVTEKMAKAFNTPPGTTEQPDTVHGALVRFVQAAKSGSRNFARLRRCFPKGPNPQQFRAYVGSFEGIAKEIESLAPKGGRLPGGERVQAPNPEYPWIAFVQNPASPTGVAEVLRVPCEEAFRHLDPLKDKKAQKFRQFVETCIRFLEEED